jgi:hypothetical protein
LPIGDYRLREQSSQRISNRKSPIEDLQLDYSAAHGYGDRLSAIRSAQLFHDMFDVNLDSLF